MTRRRSGTPRRWAIIASGFVALSVIGLAIADAAQLNVSNAGVALGNASRCTNGPITVVMGPGTGNTLRYSVTLSSVSAACANLPVNVVLYRSNGSSEATGTGTVPAAGGTFDITTTGYRRNNVSGAALLIGTWGVPATWSQTPVVVPAITCIELTSWTGGWPPPDTYGTPTGGTCTAAISNYAEWGSPLSNFNFTFTVTGADNWELTFDFASTPQFPGFTPTNVGGTLNPRLAPGYACSQMPILVARKYLPYASNTGYIEANSLGVAMQNQLCP